jgi:flagellar basal body-associated protein FliL
MARSELPPQAPYGSSQAWPDLTRTDNGSSKKLSKGLLIATIILLVVLVAGGAAGYLVLRSKGGQTSQARITATPVLHATATKAPTPSPTPTQNGATTGTVGNEGQPIAAGNEWIATLTHVDETSNSFIPPASGQTYLEISLSLKNTEATSQLVSSLLQFSLTDASGKSYSETKGVGDTNIKDLLDGSVGAGQTLKGQIPYQVPLSVHDFTLTFKYDLIDGSSASISWNIHV